MSNTYCRYLIFTPDQDQSVKEWWIGALKLLPKSLRRRKAALLMYIAWNLWKERNRGVFEGKESEPPDVMRFIKEEIDLCVTGHLVPRLYLQFYD
jgi:hypothetical protein